MRDLKPDNIFIVPDSEAPGGERAKLLDFGIAKMADEYRGTVRTQVNVIMGTPAYMAPEQCRGSRSVGGKIDVYALGCILFEMLTGRTPFVTSEPGEFLALHMLTPAPALDKCVPGLPPALTALVARMLANLADPLRGARHRCAFRRCIGSPRAAGGARAPLGAVPVPPRWTTPGPSGHGRWPATPARRGAASRAYSLRSSIPDH